MRQDMLTNIYSELIKDETIIKYVGKRILSTPTHFMWIVPKVMKTSDAPYGVFPAHSFKLQIQISCHYGLFGCH